MLKLATILDNPGEPSAQTRYRDPKQLAQLGYNGVVIYETTGLSGVDAPDSVGTGEMGRWVAQQFDRIGKRLEEVTRAGLAVYITYDALSLAANTVEEHRNDYVCRNRPGSLCPASEATVDRSCASLKQLLGNLPPVNGVVLRFGDNDAARLPYLVGNDIYSPHCPRCSQLGRADRIINIITRFHELVVTKMNKRLIARAWNVRPNGMHDSVELCGRIAPQLPGDPKDDRFVLSFKFTHTDFWRYQRWNPASLAFGDRPIIYELQCQREFEGKGGMPNWQLPMWRDGAPEVADRDEVHGLRGARRKVNLAGLWAWVRGGGWGGPFVRNETWIDANACCVPLLADDPDREVDAFADKWIHDRLGVTDERVAATIRQVIIPSSDVALHGFYIGPFARAKSDSWHPNADWIQDDVLDAQAAWRIIQRLPEASLDEVVQEKQNAARQLADSRSALQQLVTASNRSTLDPMVNTLIYGESLLISLRDLLAGLVAYRRYLKSRDAAEAETCRRRLLASQSHWNHHAQRNASMPGTPTAFREVHFWDLTQRILTELS